MAPIEITFLYHDPPGVPVSKVLDAHDRARMQVFGISAGWVSEAERDEMAIRHAIANGDSRVYQCGCVVCGKFLRRERESKSKVEENAWIKMMYDGFESEAGCQHFDQFRAFVDGLAAGSAYAAKIDEAIKARAQLIRAGKA